MSNKSDRKAPPCPSCDGPLEREFAFRPFCSERCKLVDLGKWLGEEYCVAAPYDEAEAFDPGEE